jgi:NADPH-dependent curcumin reductase CurA
VVVPSNRQVLLASRPAGFPTEANFKLVETPVPAPADGQFLVRNHWLSLDPYMRGRMDAVKSYAKYVELGEVMTGGAVGEIVASRHPQYAVGEFVTGAFGWQEYALSDGAFVRRVDPKRAPLSYALGVLGMPGVTAWVGLLDIAQAKAGESVLVSAASGAVGSVVGQLAKIKGCRAVGIAGGAAKCEYAVSELGFDACVDYKQGALYEDLKAALPEGSDVLFENVGGESLDTALRLMKPFSRIAICGLISQYSATEQYGLRNIRSVLVNRIRMQGFIVSDRPQLWPQALAELAEHVAAGRIKYRESVAKGLEQAPRAFLGMLRGENFGKQLVALA